MKIVYNDGGILTCYKIEVNGSDLFCDDMYTVPISDVERIEEDDADEEEFSDEEIADMGEDE